MDLRSLSDTDLDQLRRDTLDEQDRRRNLEQLPDQLAAMTRDAIAAGCDPEVIRECVDDALTPEQAAALGA